MVDKTLKSQTLNGMFWKLCEKVGAQLMQIIIQIILARMLLPEEYGMVGLLTIFINVSDVFLLQGFTTALIQKKDTDEVDYSSVFYANVIMSLLIYIILFLLAPLVSEFYHEPQLASIMRVLSLNVIIGSLPAVHNAILSRGLEFKKSFFRNIANTFTQGVVGITLAIYGFGAWSMVFSKLSGAFVGAVILWATVKWRPSKKFSISRLRTMFSYSSKVLVSNLLNTIFNNIHSLIIGHYFSTADVGFYQRGQQLPQSLMSSIDGSMTEVLYPAFSKVQDDIPKLKNAIRRSIKISMYATLPILFGLLAVAKTFMVVFLTEKWLPCVPFMQLSCVVCMFWPLAHRTHALNAIGKSDITLKISIFTKLITIIAIFCCIRFGIYTIMLGTIFSSCISLFITSFYIKKYIGYSLHEMIMDIFPVLVLSGIMVGVVWLIQYIPLHNILVLFIQIIAGGMIYVIGSIIFKIESFVYLINMIKPVIKGKNSTKL